ncbi:protein of unknown function [Granulicella rosea]|uniref:TMEM205-like domain-containing protein n=1 Tax=Granulicella rosea TaxID=474952 RepID=A0A239J6W5_9BACT|nr:DUF4149 domain-containing protein [Granulicella rosea]SNT00394.1 protein of unknown function [Granulicella rosea]
MQTILRFLQLIAMVVWVGGIVFFAFVLAPYAFHNLPTQHLAGVVVGGTLRILHLMGFVCGGLFWVATAILFTRAPMRVRGRYEMQLMLSAVMLLATAYLQANVLPAMDLDVSHAGGDINAVAATHPARVHFEKLHVRSERVEGVVLLFGIGVLLLMARENPDPANT